MSRAVAPLDAEVTTSQTIPDFGFPCFGPPRGLAILRHHLLRAADAIEEELDRTAYSEFARDIRRPLTVSAALLATSAALTALLDVETIGATPYREISIVADAITGFYGTVLLGFNFDRALRKVVEIGNRIAPLFSRDLRPFPLTDIARADDVAITEVSQLNLELCLGNFSILPDATNLGIANPATISTTEFIKAATQFASLAQFKTDVGNTFRRTPREQGSDESLFSDLAGDDNIFHFLTIANIVAATKRVDGDLTFGQRFPCVNVEILNQKYEILAEKFNAYCQRKYGDEGGLVARRMTTRIHQLVVAGGDLLSEADLIATLEPPAQRAEVVIAMAASGSTAEEAGAGVGVDARMTPLGLRLTPLATAREGEMETKSGPASEFSPRSSEMLRYLDGDRSSALKNKGRDTS